MPYTPKNNIYMPAAKPESRKNRAVQTLAVFCMVLVLVFPVFAQEEMPCGQNHVHDSACCAGMVLHTHGDFCRDSQGNVICPLPELEEHEHTEDCYEAQHPETSRQGHVHSDACYVTEQGALICTAVQHVHSDECYQTIAEEDHVHVDACYTKQQGELTCTVPEYEGHTHNEACYISDGVLLCTVEESAEHTHDASCYGRCLICETPENAGHIHGNDCYEWLDVPDACVAVQKKVLVCTVEEQPAHIHTDACYERVSVLVCGGEEQQPERTDEEKRLTCLKYEFKNHVHTETCYETDAAGQRTLICREIPLEAHHHTEACLDFTDMVLLCTEEESEAHTHDYRCYQSWTFRCRTPADEEEETADQPEEPADESVEESAPEPEEPDSDPMADVERPKDWEKTFKDVELTGAWCYDLLAIAETQLGYQESERNYIELENGSLKGYTRYGAWYGVPYGDWCAMFVSFCLDYAGVEDFPLHCNCDRWVDILAESELYAEADAYMPRPGDLVFFDYKRSGTTSDDAPAQANHVAIVAEVIPATPDKPAELITIEGNRNDAVCCETRSLDDPRIIGYGMLPDGPAAIYACGLDAHTHDSGCYDEEGTILCRLQEHTHDEICRSRKLVYADEEISLDITLSNAVYLPEDLSLQAELIRDQETPAYGEMAAAVDRMEQTVFCCMALCADGEPFQLPVGVQAHVQISFAKPEAAADGAQWRVFTLDGQSGKKSAPYEAQEVSIDSCRNTMEGMANVYFTTNHIGAFAMQME